MADSSPQSSRDEENDSPIEEVRLTVPLTDDPTQPALTFRTWVLGLTSCVILAFVNQFFTYRQNPLDISSVSVQIAALPLGKLMAMTLPSKPIKFPLTGWSFSMNPGPFNIKEHVLISIFAASGASNVYAVHIITSALAYYHRTIHPMAAFLLAQTTQLLGYGWAGLFRKYLVDSPYMWWPASLAQVSFFRALHEKEKRHRRGLTRLQFFLMAFVSSFVYYIVPGYLFPSVSTVSLLCLIWKDSITLQQIGSGLHGLGLGSLAFDWATISMMGSPLTSPAFAIFNVLVGFFLVVYVAVPLLCYNNVYDGRRFPMISAHAFDSEGQTYNISRILDQENFEINWAAYDGYSKLHLSVTFAFNSIGLGFAALTATLSHVALFHGQSIWKMWKSTGEALKNQLGDVHTRLMKKNYDEVPQWWFLIILVSMVALSLLACEGFDKQLQLPWWGVFLACGVALVFTLPIGIIVATTGSAPGLNIITQLVIGYLYPGKPIANVTFRNYGFVSTLQALWITGDFKLGHYMKIPPKSMFIAQLVGTMVASTIYFSIAWWLLTTVEHICDPSLLPSGSPWTCPMDDVFFNESIIWGVVGPLRMFTKLGNYPEMNWFFLIGLLAPVPVWALTKAFPEKKWFAYINMPVILAAAEALPPVRSVNYISWGAVGLFFNFYVYKKHKGWWARYNYVLSAGLDAGMALLAVLLYVTIQYKGTFGPEWWGLEADDHCPLASCPTALGAKVEGCPVL
ncbi:hypothetical protein CDL15_Pgr011305 [Punica granatum]|uniref:Oligopeptide transporter 1-like n=1 Tax=Punica granatum TaxID=22663 RepID=A0A218WFB8_PUNGR|nr:hypothetical protein CDL15_Pgr011305 [Punica granatum]